MIYAIVTSFFGKFVNSKDLNLFVFVISYNSNLIHIITLSTCIGYSSPPLHLYYLGMLVLLFFFNRSHTLFNFNPLNKLIVGKKVHCVFSFNELSQWYIQNSIL